MATKLELAHQHVQVLKKEHGYYRAICIASDKFGVSRSDLGAIGAEHRKNKYSQPHANDRRVQVQSKPSQTAIAQDQPHNEIPTSLFGDISPIAQLKGR